VVAAAVPVKKLSIAKERLSGLLSPFERKQICIAMLYDVLDALRATPEVSQIHIVTSDSELSAILSPAYSDARIIREPARSGLNGALEYAASRLAGYGATRMVIVPADLPLIRPAVLGELVRASEHAAVAIVPDRSGVGTNLLVLSPPSAIPPRFGGNSLAEHLDEARRRHLRYTVLPAGRPSWDVDFPADILAVIRYGRGTNTHAQVCQAGIDKRLTCISQEV
jgi:2-phospho-L-lactate guanylyltransferase